MADDRFLRRTRWPRKHDADFRDFAASFQKFVLPGHVPAQPLLTRTDMVFTQGSCFAEEIHNALDARALKSAYMPLGEEINSPLANRLLFEYALTDRPYAVDEHERAFPRTSHAALRELLPRVKLFILTLGVGFSPFRDGHLTIHIAPNELQNVTWRLLSAEEQAAHIRAIIAALRQFNPTLPVVLTVSPIPLKNAFTHDSPVVADCVSKSTLRAAAEMVLQSDIPHVMYWPAFEAIRWLPGHSGAVFGIEGATDHRHIASRFVRVITDAFIAAYYRDPPPMPGA